jgi:cell division protein FtsI/penicillin-binding protein 2
MATISSESDSILKATPAQRAAASYGMRLCAALIVVLALGAGYREVVQGSSLVARDDNPRNVDAERAIDRDPILARDGTILAVSQDLNAGYPRPSFVRHYPHPDAAPVVGYYSLWHGVGGVERYADARLRGHVRLTDRLLHRTQIGGPFTITLDLQMQDHLATALSGTTGSGIILDWRSGEVLAMVSTPSYDPNTLNDNWDTLRARADAPLVNRATQGLYQPGTLLKWMYTQAAARGNQWRQPVEGWDATDQFNLGKPVEFELDNAAVAYPARATYSETIGQGVLRLTPLRVAVTAASLAAARIVTPTIRLGPQNASPPQILPVLTTGVDVFVPISHDKQVGWHVQIGSRTVTVLALELPNASTDQLRSVVSKLPSEP